MEPAHSPIEQSAAPLTTAPNNRKRTIIALWLMIGPTALIIASLILYGIANFIFGATAAPAPDGAMFGESSVAQKSVNVLLFLIGAVSVATWLPGLIVGIVLLATRKK